MNVHDVLVTLAERIEKAYSDEDVDICIFQAENEIQKIFEEVILEAISKTKSDSVVVR
jgi:hypothetical protein